MEHKPHQIFNAHRAVCSLERQCRLVADRSGCGGCGRHTGPPHVPPGAYLQSKFLVSAMSRVFPNCLKPRCCWPSLSQRLSASGRHQLFSRRHRLWQRRHLHGDAKLGTRDNQALLVRSHFLAPLGHELVNVCLASLLNLWQ